MLEIVVAGREKQAPPIACPGDSGIVRWSATQDPETGRSQTVEYRYAGSSHVEMTKDPVVYQLGAANSYEGRGEVPFAIRADAPVPSTQRIQYEMTVAGQSGTGHGEFSILVIACPKATDPAGNPFVVLPVGPAQLTLTLEKVAAANLTVAYAPGEEGSLRVRLTSNVTAHRELMVRVFGDVEAIGPANQTVVLNGTSSQDVWFRFRIPQDATGAHALGFLVEPAGAAFAAKAPRSQQTGAFPYWVAEGGEGGKSTDDGEGGGTIPGLGLVGLLGATLLAGLVLRRRAR